MKSSKIRVYIDDSKTISYNKLGLDGGNQRGRMNQIDLVFVGVNTLDHERAEPK